MKILLTGTSGMVGQAALAACIADPAVTEIVALVRKPLGRDHPKVKEVVCLNLFKLVRVQDQIGIPDACLFCAGVSSVGMTEPVYRRDTYEMTLAVARDLYAINPKMYFLYVSGVGTDSTEKGNTMWARVKGATENALTRIGFAGVANFRPGYIQPLGGVKSKVGWYNAIYAIAAPLYPLLKSIFPKQVTDTRTLGKAMIAAVQPGMPTAIYEPADINRIGA
jgi:uncharacterized protein YbjT (DUF2867 family)